jgi:hypothetical protein
MFTIEIRHESAKGTYSEKIIAKDEAHAEMIRRTARQQTQPGDSQTIKVTRN